MVSNSISVPTSKKTLLDTIFWPTSKKNWGLMAKEIFVTLLTYPGRNRPPRTVPLVYNFWHKTPQIMFYGCNRPFVFTVSIEEKKHSWWTEL